MVRARCRAFAVIALFLAGLPACGSKATGPVSMLSEKDKAYVRTTLRGMKDEVQLVLFSRDGGACASCGKTEGLLLDIAAADPRVKVEILSLKKEAARARELGIDKVPGIALLGRKDYNLRYFGLPGGHDLVPFVETLRAVGDENPGVSRETAEQLTKLTKPVQISVFVTQS